MKSQIQKIAAQPISAITAAISTLARSAPSRINATTQALNSTLATICAAISTLANTLVAAAILIASPKAGAEYRAFELKIENVEKSKVRTVITTLDHLQYPRLYPVEKDEIVTYVDSWMCRENMSNFRPACPKPSAQP